MDVFTRRLPYLIAWLQQALAVTEGTACRMATAQALEMPRGPDGAPPPFESFPSLNYDEADDDIEQDDADAYRRRERDEDDGLTYADPRDERKARRGAV